MKSPTELKTIAIETRDQMKQNFPDISVCVLVWNSTAPIMSCSLAMDAPNRAQVAQLLRQHADAMEREHGQGRIVPVTVAPKG